MEKAAFLGVGTSTVRGPLREQLKLKRGMGLVVDFVEPGSPAEAAGLKQFDVLEKLADQWLVNTEQMSALIRSMKPDEKLTLAIIRGGERLTINPTLGERELPSPDDDALMRGPGGRKGNVIFEGRGEFRDGPGGRQRVMNIVGRVPGAKVVFKDDEHSMTIESREGGKYLTARDKDGKTVFEGPVETPGQKSKLPAELAGKLEKFEAKMVPQQAEGDGPDVDFFDDPPPRPPEDRDGNRPPPPRPGDDRDRHRPPPPPPPPHAGERDGSGPTPRVN